MSFTATPVFIFFTIGTEMLGNRTVTHATIQKKCQKSAVKQRHSLFDLVTVFVVIFVKQVFRNEYFHQIYLFINQKYHYVITDNPFSKNNMIGSHTFNQTFNVIMTFQVQSKNNLHFATNRTLLYICCIKEAISKVRKPE